MAEWMCQTMAVWHRYAHSVCVGLTVHGPSRTLRVTSVSATCPHASARPRSHASAHRAHSYAHRAHAAVSRNCSARSRNCNARSRNSAASERPVTCCARVTRRSPNCAVVARILPPGFRCLRTRAFDDVCISPSLCSERPVLEPVVLFPCDASGGGGGGVACVTFDVKTPDALPDASNEPDISHDIGRTFN
jgi:hypothetical protein